MRKIKIIVVHCSATPSGRALTQGKLGDKNHRSAAAIIDDWHFQRQFNRGAAARRVFNPALRSIGYHFVIDTSGEVFTGRAIEEIGAHVANHNAASIGVCMVGGIEREGKFTPAQWSSLADLVRQQAGALLVPLQFAADQTNGVCGHRDLSPDLNGNGTIESREWLKTCPGFDVQAWLERGLVPELKNVIDGATA